MTIEQIIERAAQIIHNDLRHADYQRTVDVAKKAYRFATGDGLENDLTPFTLSETAEEFEIRKLITRLTVPAIINNIMSVANKIPKSRAQRDIRYKDKGITESEADVQIINDKMSNFWGDSGGLDEYVDLRYWELNTTDPNTWVVTEFDKFDASQFAAPYPFEVSAADAWDFAHEKQVLQFLSVHTPVTFLDQHNIEQVGIKLTVYCQNETIIFTQVKPTPESGGFASRDNYNLTEANLYTKDRVFTIERPTPHNVGFVPAKRVGFVRDMITNGRTFVTLFHVAYPTIESGLKTKSELDATMSFSAFPHRAEYVPACDAPGCLSGKMHNGEACSSCSGTGYKKVTSHLHVTRLPMPSNLADIFDLDNLRSFKGPETTLIQFMKEYWMYLEQKALKDVYNSDIFARNEVVKTATEKDLEMQSVQDTLVTAAKYCAEFWSHLVFTVAGFIDKANDLIAKKRYSNNFRFKTPAEIIAELQAVDTVGNAPFVRSAIMREMIEVLYYNDPDKILQFEFAEKINPFAGQSEMSVSNSLASPLVPSYYKTLYIMMSEVTRRISNKPGIQTAMALAPEALDSILRDTVGLIEAEAANDRPILTNSIGA
jgi:hypothetical protein